MSVTKRALFDTGYFNNLASKEEREGTMSKQLHRKMTGYSHVLTIYSSLSNTDKAYITRGDDERAKTIRGLLKDIKKHRTEALADQLLPLLIEVKKLGESSEQKI